MLWTCQTACVFPASWIKIHLPVLICHPDQVTQKQPERDIYGDCLIALLEGFITLLERLNAPPPPFGQPFNRPFNQPFNQPPQEPFRFTYGVRKIGGVVQKIRTFGQGIQERNRNLLAIAVIHLTSMNAPPRGTVDIYERAQKVRRSCCAHMCQFANKIRSFLRVVIFSVPNFTVVRRLACWSRFTRRLRNMAAKTA